MNHETRQTDLASRATANWTHFLYAGLILLGCVAFYQAAQTENLLRRISSAQKENAALRTTLTRSEREFRDSLLRFHSDLSAMQGELATAHQQADDSLAKAQAATKYADALAARLEKRRRDQEKKQQQLSTQLSQVQQSADDTSRRLNGISNEVGGVKDTLDAVRAHATQNGTVLSELKDGVTTNTKQIDALREKGDKDIIVFSLKKDGGVQKVGRIQMKLEKTDEKRNTFTLEIDEGDKRIEKRDRTVNEPVQFFVSTRPGQPYELVINEVSKGGVKGYLSAPKATIER